MAKIKNRLSSARAIASELLGEFLFEGGRSWVWPYLAPVVMAVLGYLEGLPWMYVGLAMAIAF